MKRGISLLGLTIILFVFLNVSHAQETSSKWGLGLDAGAQRLYGDPKSVSLGVGFEGFLTYRALRFADLVFSMGYGQLRYKLAGGTSNTTNLINLDLKGNFELLSRGRFRPFLSLGLGVVNFHVGNSVGGRFSDATFFGGGGFKFRLSPKFDWLIGADYRFSTGDTFDSLTLNPQGTSNDGYLNVRAGFAYHLSGRGSDFPDVIASESAPLFEVGDEDFTGEPQSSSKTPDLDSKNMEEYVKLKSRIDQLSQTVDSQESEVATLQSTLSERKQKLTALEQRAAKARPVPRKLSSSLSGFSEIYEEALTSYYNKKYEDAVSLFRLLIEKYPNHSLASNYQYWLGQSLLALNRYQESITAFYKVLSFERSFKKDDALFILGKTYLKIGSGENAKESFARLIREYPTSEYVAEAKSYIEKL